MPEESPGQPNSSALCDRSDQVQLSNVPRPIATLACMHLLWACLPQSSCRWSQHQRVCVQGARDTDASQHSHHRACLTLEGCLQSSQSEAGRSGLPAISQVTLGYNRARVQEACGQLLEAANAYKGILAQLPGMHRPCRHADSAELAQAPGSWFTPPPGLLSAQMLEDLCSHHGHQACFSLSAMKRGLRHGSGFELLKHEAMPASDSACLLLAGSTLLLKHDGFYTQV